MRYRISECVICGIAKPNLVFRAWVESSAVKFIVRDRQMQYFIKEFEPTRSKVYQLDLHIDLSIDKKNNEYELLVVDTDGKETIIKTVTTNPLQRLLQKYKPKYSKTPTKFAKNKEAFKLTGDLKNDRDYQEWINKFETFSDVQDYAYQPLISIVMPVYNVDGKYLSACIDSILAQTYQNFEICIADDCSTNQNTLDTLHRYIEQDKRIKVCFRKQNGHISEATNSALALAQGEFIGLMDNDDMLVKHALNEVVKVLNEDKTLDFVYTDEDKIDMEGNRSDPHFKSDFSLDSFYGGNYVCHFSVIRTKLVKSVKGFRKGYEGAQDFELFLRVTNLTDRIYHIPKILYHWRMIPGSTALDSKSKNYAGEAGKQALLDIFKQKGIDIEVEILVHTHYMIEYILKDEPLVEIIIDLTSIHENLVKNLSFMIKNFIYKNYKILLFVKKDENHSLHDFPLQIQQRLQIVEYANNNVLEAMNIYTKSSKASYLLFLNERSMIDTFNAIDLMVGYASTLHAGMIGCKILNKKKAVLESGILFENKQVLPATYMTYHDDYGFYGKLLTAINYRALEDKCVMIKTDLFIETGGFDIQFDYQFAIYDLCLRLHEAGKRNIFLPQVLSYYDGKDIITTNTSFTKKWEGYLDSDPYYNENLAKFISYRLPK